MSHRWHRPAPERHARSRLVQLISEQPLLRGSLVVMRRKCGKSGCHCQQGEKHSSLYLAVRAKNKRTMIYIPSALEETAREWIGNGRRVDELLDFVSQQCLAQLLDQKQQALGRSPEAAVRRKRRRKGRAP